MKKLMITSLLAVMAQTQAAEFCYERTYTAQEMAKFSTQIVKSIQLKITEPGSTGALLESETQAGMYDGYSFLLNTTSRDGKTYVYENQGAADPARTVSGIRSAYSGEGPFGSFDFEVYKENIYQLKIVDDLNVIEKNTFCNDGLECVDSKWLKASDKVNNIYRLKSMDCSKLVFSKHEFKEKKVEAKPSQLKKSNGAGLGMTISYKGKMIYSLTKDKTLSAQERALLQIPSNVVISWKRYYELTQIDLEINGQKTGLQPVNPKDANALVFDPSFDDLLGMVYAEARTWKEKVEEIQMEAGDVKWDSKGNLLAADIAGTLRRSGFLGSTVGAQINIEGSSLGGSVQVNEYKCAADKTLTKLICNVDYVTSANVDLNMK